MSVERWLPLFPLNVVLFPNASMPLHVFEDRYKLMMQDCLDGDSRFGVVLIKAGSEVGEPAIPHSVGTVAQIAQVNRHEDGRILIGVTGRQRFKIKEIAQYRPYVAAQVELLEDAPEATLPSEEMEEIREAVTEHIRLTIGLRGGWIREARVPSDPVALSYLVARILMVGLPEKQALLEEESTSSRLEAGLRLLRREEEGRRKRVAQEMGKRYSRQ